MTHFDHRAVSAEPSSGGPRPGAGAGPAHREAAAQEAGARRRAWAGLIAVLLLATAALLWMRARGEAPPTTPTRTTLPIPEGAGPWPHLVQPLSIAPDGDRIVFHSIERGETDAEGRGGLWSRTLPDGEAVRIPGTDRAGSHFLSPDGAWIAFHDVEDGTLRRIPVRGGEPEVLTSTEATGASAFLGGAWSEDGSIVYALRTGMRRLFVETGVQEALTTTDPDGDVRHLEPYPLPDGSGVVYTIGRTSSPETDVAVLRFGGAGAILVAGHSARPAGRPPVLVFGSGDDALHAVRMQADWSAVSGDPIVVQEGVLGASLPYPRKAFALADDGTLSFLPAGDAAWSELLWVSRSGEFEPVLDTRALQLPPGGRLAAARLSPDGRKVALRIGNPADDPAYKLFVLDLPTRVLSPIVVEANADWPVWFPDGERLVFNRFPSSPDAAAGHELYTAPADTIGPPAPITEGNTVQQHAQTFTADGRWLVVQQRDTAGGEGDLWLLPVGHDAEATPIVQGPRAEMHAALSPDGHWLAYAVEEGDTSRVFVTDFPEARTQAPVSGEAGHSPVWNPLGGELFYRRSADGAVVAVGVEGDSILSLGAPQVLFTGPFDQGSSFGRSFDVAPDGEHFLLIGDAGRADDAPRVEVVRGWLQDVRRRLDRSTVRGTGQ